MFFTAYIIAISSGFSVSHIHCNHGERWVIGSEMPPKKHQTTNDNRTKETYHFFVKIDAEGSTYAPSENHEQNQLTPQHKPLYKALKPLYRPAPQLKSLAPPERKKPKRTELQVFLI